MSDIVRNLNQLLAVHGSSLPLYLASAPPHRQFGDQNAWECLRDIIDDQQVIYDKIADYVETLGGTPNGGEFPMEFTGMHDLSVDHIMQDVLRRQKCETEQIERLSGQLESDPTAKALAQEALGAAKAHVQSLEESITASSA